MKLHSENGTAVVEFAIILPLLLIIVFGIIEFGFIFYNKAILTNASREGARAGIAYTFNGDGDRIVSGVNIEEAINRQLYSDFPDNSKLRLITFGTKSISINPNSSDGDMIITSAPYYIPVRVDFNYDFLLIPSFIPGIPNTIKLSGITTMRAE